MKTTVWQWQDDDGTFKAYDAATNAAIEEVHQDFVAGTPGAASTVSLPGGIRSVDFNLMKQVRDSTGFKRTVRRTAPTVTPPVAPGAGVWAWREDSGAFTAYPDDVSADIEAQFTKYKAAGGSGGAHAVFKLPGPAGRIIEFDHMHQKRPSTGFTRAVQRTAAAATGTTTSTDKQLALLLKIVAKSSQWEWQENDGSWHEFTPDLNKAILKAHVKYKSGVGARVFRLPGSIERDIDFDALTQKRVSTGATRRVREHVIRPEPVEWQWRKDDGTYTAYDDASCGAIELAYSQFQKGVGADSFQLPQAGSANRKIDFKKMRQIRVDTSHERAVRRLSLKAAATARASMALSSLTATRWEWEDDGPVYRPYDPATTVLIENAYLAWSRARRASSKPAGAGGAGAGAPAPAKVTLPGTPKRQIDFTTMKQVRTSTSFKRSVKRHANNTSDFVIPSNWDPQTGNFKLVAVPKGGPEWTQVETSLLKTVPAAKITAIERVQNKILRWRFEFACRLMEDRDGSTSGLNITYLWHGSKGVPPADICAGSGIDFRHTSSGNLYGRGAYFAVRAAYSNAGYSHVVTAKSGSTPATKQLIIAEVLVGKAKDFGTTTKTSLVKPPDGYDTVLAGPHSSSGESTRMHVTYDRDYSYPAFIVTYQV